MRYFKFRWNESRGDEFDDWGKSTFYHELDDEFFAVRQIVIYDNGNVLKYDETYFSDEFGILADKSLEEVLDDPDTSEILQDEFEAVWNLKKALNYQ